jgi:glycerol-3-phosphate dehydrogenase (NAD(P)+)
MISKPVGIIGGGNFGMAIAKLISAKHEVILHSRRQEFVDDINQGKDYKQYPLSPKLSATIDIKEICQKCDVIYPVTPSEYFYEMICNAAPHLSPRHILIHGTKGFHLYNEKESLQKLDIDEVNTMSQLILAETDVKRIGALCGPNLAKEILEELPTATVVASQYDEVIKIATKHLSGPQFYVFNSYDVIGAEMAGALKNVIAIASGIVGGRNFGKNAEAMLITRGLNEIIKMASLIGVSYEAFLGTAGIGDLIATATSPLSRNYTCGIRIAKGETVDEILASSTESIEGLRSLKVAHALINKHRLPSPIVSIIYQIIYEGKDVDESIKRLMRYPVTKDVDFIN